MENVVFDNEIGIFASCELASVTKKLNLTEPSVYIAPML
jgi:hypothetical protein